MSLYNRNMPQNNYEGTGSAFGGAFEQSAQREATSARATFVKQTYQLLAASLLAATAGAYIGTNSASLLSGGAYWIAVIAEFACLFGLMFARKNAKLALILLFAFTFISGLVLGPTLARYIGAGMGNVITQAFLMTTVAFGGLSVFAMNTKRDFSAMGKFLFIALIVIIVASLINIFVGSSMLSLAVSGAGALIFSAYILYDTQNIIRGAYDSPVLAAVSLYLDILNLFISLLHILGALNNNK
ncbi:MAG: Bax inhibitor-1/YccA family protein [Campylobacter sp.]|uniref:Bax inhibitor-1/YccA family protein n=1 Tax=Campylobacter sp. TaxID=205 RepID=UPI002977F9CC|nr:Bax inhibitor-1/YccA family protein [Campylobacter sp.]MDD7600408.1 Bax inhibitor-1/YccA family protein [Campylobacteraceae bacterium]MDY5888278.1 Bax inhibitor-1/YccA family protein [Campylobacter sp.]